MMSDVSARIILYGARNFRDIGGLPAAGGRKVRIGKLFRSNRLSRLTPGDRAILDGLGLVAIFDLRARAEREQDPTSWSSPSVVTHVFPSGHKRRLIDMALDYPPTRAGALALMRDFYREMPRAMGHAFGEMMVRIGEGAAPCVIHCSAGKDRTVVAVAILLAALGVSRDEIISDYVRSASIPTLEEDMARAVTMEGDRQHPLRRYPADAISAMMGASADYIEQALDGIDEQFGSLEAYLRENGVCDRVIANLRERLLEDDVVSINARRQNLR